MNILETKRLIMREMDPDADAEFICELLNSPKFVKYIGDRGVRTIKDSREFIENRYRQSYRDHGFGLYTVELKNKGDDLTDQTFDAERIGVCGFVRRDTLPGPDLGFAFLPEFEGKGYGFESAAAVMEYGRNALRLERVFAITSLGNDASVRLLEKLGFEFDRLIGNGDETLKLFSCENCLPVAAARQSSEL